MFHPSLILGAITASLNLLRAGKEVFYPDKAEALLKKRLADDIGSLEQRLTAHRDILDKLVEQVKADKAMLEQHNTVLIQLSEATKETVAAVAWLRTLSYWSMGLAACAILAAILIALLK